MPFPMQRNNHDSFVAALNDCRVHTQLNIGGIQISQAKNRSTPVKSITNTFRFVLLHCLRNKFAKPANPAFLYISL